MSTVSSVDLPVPAELPVRIAARVIDAVVVTAITVGLGLVIGFGFDWLIVGAAIILGYFVLLDALAGATLGKLALGLRVTGPDGGRPTLVQALRREAVTILGSIPLVGVLLAVVAWIKISRAINRDPLRQGDHDRLAGGTRVVQARPRRAAQGHA